MSLMRAYSLVCILLAVCAATSLTFPPPTPAGAPVLFGNVLDLNGTETNTQSIEGTVRIVNQKGGATDNTPPNQPVPETTLTAIDGELLTNKTTVSGAPTALGSFQNLTRRTNSGYELVFSGSESGPDGSIQGTAYLTYTVLPNNTYNIDDCLSFCGSVQQCVFANLYYEFNNYMVDSNNVQSNLKCALYGDIHNATEKTNLGGQQLLPPPAGLTYITNSTGWAAKTLAEPAVPEGYELVFGPIDGANNSPGYMGFAFLDKYDVSACASLCNNRGADPMGGACQYFNIWRALVNGEPTTYTCSMYYIPADQTSATNFGQGDLAVTYSRGYRRTSVLQDGGFEGFDCGDICYNSSYANWLGISPSGGQFDAAIANHQAWAHSGKSIGWLGSIIAADEFPGTLTPVGALNTTSGNVYTITFFHASAYSGEVGEANAFLDVMWNGEIVSTIRPGYSQWTYYEFPVTAKGSDVVAFRGGLPPAWSWIDDIYVFEI
ncbi:hypothetical protein L208DRAFT_1423082 [Tricholoma matsutake]|nr:hypothetical protein L208DRAFT_1423082 [Tricholoma matsutake 945]